MAYRLLMGYAARVGLGGSVTENCGESSEDEDVRGLKTKRFRYWLGFCALAATATHMVSADGKFFFSERNDADFVLVKKVSASPFKFKFSRCHADGPCVEFGKKQGYTLEDVRIPVFKLIAKREKGRLSSVESHELETLQEIIHGIESPRLHFPQAGYSHSFKGPAEQFMKVVDERLGTK